MIRLPDYTPALEKLAVCINNAARAVCIDRKTLQQPCPCSAATADRGGGLIINMPSEAHKQTIVFLSGRWEDSLSGHQRP